MSPIAERREPGASKHGAKLRFWARIGVSAALLAILLASADLDGFTAAVARVELGLFGLVLGIVALGNLVRAYKWRLLLRALGAEVPLGDVHAMSYMALFLNNFFPGTVGGDSFRAYQTVGYANSASDAVAAVVMDRFTGLVGLFLVVMIAALASALAPNPVLSGAAAHRVAGVALLALIASLAIGHRASRLRIVGPLRRLPRLGHFLGDLARSVTAYRAKPRELLVALLLSTLHYATMIVGMYCYAAAADVAVGLGALAVVVPVVSLAIVVPIAFNGIGLQEGAFFVLLRRLGISSQDALLLSILPRVGMLLISLVGGLVLLLHPSAHRLSQTPDDGPR